MSAAQRSLDEIRAKIDQIDTRLLELLNERADLVHEVGVIKKEAGLRVYVPEREEALLLALAEKNQGRLPAASIRAIYREIMSASLALEKDLTIAYLGPEATWTHQAARSNIRPSKASVTCSTRLRAALPITASYQSRIRWRAQSTIRWMYSSIRS
jgi:chorismate mutase-like protein